MSEPSRDLQIQISEAELATTSYHHIRIRMLSTIGAPVEVKLMPKREFHTFLTVHSAVNFSLLVICFMITIILLAYGIFCREEVYTFLGITALFMFLWILQLKGIGPLYVWNKVAELNNSSRLVYFFVTGFFVMSTILLVSIMREGNPEV